MTFNEFNVAECTAPHRHVLFILAAFRDQSTPPARTPARYRFPLLGAIDMALSITVTQQFSATIQALDAKGNPAPLDGIPAWATDNSDVLAVEPSVDGLTAVVKATGVLGTARVQVNGDADLGQGVAPIIGTLDVAVTAGQAVTIAIQPGPVTEQP